MGFKDFFRKLQGPPRVAGGPGDDPGEVDAALREDYTPAHEADAGREAQKNELAEDLAAAPVAATPFSGAGQADATEIELGLEEDVEPEEDEEGPLEPQN
jgi:hypothetical protein